MLVKIHSFVDVITNSSTIIYTQFKESAIQDSYEMINEILKLGGSDKKAEDLFDISISPCLDNVYDIIGDMDEEEIDDLDISEEDKKLLLLSHTKYDEMEYDDYMEWQEENLTPFILENWKLIADEDSEQDIYLSIVAKDTSKSTKDLGDMICNMFDCEEGYN